VPKKKAKKKAKTKKKAAKKTAKKKAKTKKKAAKKTAKKKTKAKVAKKKTKKKTNTKSTAKKKSKKKKRLPKGVVPWRERFKQDRTGPWTCPKCGPLNARAQPLYGEDERHHCPNDDCDSIVSLLSKEDLEPTERRGSWPPQRNKNRNTGDKASLKKGKKK
jgi:hypothetical protein